jgi:hypothetical protein
MAMAALSRQYTAYAYDSESESLKGPAVGTTVSNKRRWQSLLQHFHGWPLVHDKANGQLIFTWYITANMHRATGLPIKTCLTSW